MRAARRQVEVTEAGKVIYQTEHNAPGRFIAFIERRQTEAPKTVGREIRVRWDFPSNGLGQAFGPRRIMGRGGTRPYRVLGRG